MNSLTLFLDFCTLLGLILFFGGIAVESCRSKCSESTVVTYGWQANSRVKMSTRAHEEKENFEAQLKRFDRDSGKSVLCAIDMDPASASQPQLQSPTSDHTSSILHHRQQHDYDRTFSILHQQTLTAALPVIAKLVFSPQGLSRTEVLSTLKLSEMSRLLANSERAARRTSPPPLTVPPLMLTL